MAPRSASRRCTPGCPTHTPKVPTPISAVLSGLLLNVALYALLRFKMLLAANPGAIAPGPLMITLGLISLIFAAFMLYRRRDIKRMFAYSSIEHMGITVFAFGMAGPLGNFAGLLQMTMHSLTKSAIFFSVGHIAQVEGHAAHRRHGWPDRDTSAARLGPDRWRRCDRRTAAVRRVHQRVPGDQLHLRARTPAGNPVRVRSAGVVRRIVPAPDIAWHSANRADQPDRSPHPMCRCSRILRLCSLPASGCQARWSCGSSTWRHCWDDHASMPRTGRRQPDASLPVRQRCSASGASQVGYTWPCWIAALSC